MAVDFFNGSPLIPGDERADVLVHWRGLNIDDDLPTINIPLAGKISQERCAHPVYCPRLYYVPCDSMRSSSVYRFCFRFVLFNDAKNVEVVNRIGSRPGPLPTAAGK